MGSTTKEFPYDEKIASFEKKLFHELKNLAETDGIHFLPRKNMMNGRKWRIFLGGIDYIAFSLWKIPSPGPNATRGLDFNVNLNKWISFFEIFPGSNASEESRIILENVKNALIREKINKTETKHKLQFEVCELAGLKEEEKVDEIIKMVKKIHRIIEKNNIIPNHARIEEKEYKKAIERIEKEVLGGGNKKESENKENESEDGQSNLNSIFFGPPGTGKTYMTKETAVKLIVGEAHE